MAEFLGRGWGYPIAWDESREGFATAEYEESIRQSIWIILSTAPGERVMRPDFGCEIHDLVFEPNNATTRGMAERHVGEALLHWEPRIDVLEVKAVSSEENEEELLVNVHYRVRLTDSRSNLVYPFYLDRSAATV